MSGSSPRGSSELHPLGWWQLLLRCSAIIGIYTLAGAAATRRGVVTAAGHQLLNQLQIFQLTILWAFLEVGQTMVVNALAGGGGRRAARRVADRVIAWCAATSLALALATWLLRAPLARSFSQDAALLHAVELAMPPACVMLAMGWNNAMEGVLLGAGDVNFVVLGFLPAAGSGIATLLWTMYAGKGLTAIWWGLAVYYIVLTSQYSLRYWAPFLRSHHL